METKHYCAFVSPDMVECFEEELNKRDKVKYFEKLDALSEEGEKIYQYTIEAEEGVIHPKWEIK